MLFTHAGSSHQLKINEAISGDTGSIFYQANWRGQTKVGLAGSDDFSVKVSDRTTWFDAINIDLGDHAAAVESILLVFIKQVGTITATCFLNGPLSLLFIAASRVRSFLVVRTHVLVMLGDGVLDIVEIG